MSIDGFRADPDVLAAAAQSVDRSVQSLASSLQGLQATVTSQNPWGADEPGTIFGMAYSVVLNHALETISSHVEMLADARDGLGVWANTLVEVDAQVAETMRSVTNGR